MTPAAIKRFQELVGVNNVHTSPAELLCHSYDATPLLQHTPDIVVKPHTAEQLGKTLELATQEGMTVTPRGSGTGLSGGSVAVQGGLVLLTTGLNRIVELDHQDLSVTVEPGVITADLHVAVEAHGLFYPPDPGSMNISTIGGNVAENAGGLRGLKYGITGDYVQALEAFLVDGSSVKYGTKCVKDVAGYNLTKFLVGTEGTVCLYHRITLKLIPKPRTKRTFLALYDNLLDAARTVSALIRRKVIPSTLELMDSVTIGCVEDYSHIGLPRDVQALLLIETDGHPAVVAEEAAVIEEVCKANGVQVLKAAQDEKEAAELATARRMALSALARVSPTTILEDVTVPRPAIPEMIAAIQEAAREYSLKIGTFGHAGDGNLHPTCLTDERNREEIERVEKAYEVIFDKAIGLGGTISGEHGTGISKARYLPIMVGPHAVRIMRRLKQAFDPQWRLNPAKIFPKDE
jgi:glycolate oxidase